MLTAAATAGLDIDHGRSQEYILDEPSAAALYYLWKSRKHDGHHREELVFIYDFGAGTLDCSLVSIVRDSLMTRSACWPQLATGSLAATTWTSLSRSMSLAACRMSTV